MSAVMRIAVLGTLISGLPMHVLTPCCQAQTARTVRIATYNTSLNRCLDGRSNPCGAGGLPQALANPDYRPAKLVAETIQRVAPDIVLLNEFNYDEAGSAADLFQTNFLSVGQNVSQHPDGPAAPIQYPYRYLASSNTGITSGFDLDNNGRYDDTPGDGAYGNDAFGFGEFPGRYGMLLLSKYPIQISDVRTFQKFLWRDMPGPLLPDDPQTAEPHDWYSADELAVLRLSSKSHWDVPIQVGDHTLHVLASHPTPPVFDGAEDRNGKRNHDEIRLWADYIAPDKSGYLVDDAGRSGGLAVDASFVILGDMNADPSRGDSVAGAVNQLLDSPRIKATVPLQPNGSDLTATFDLRVDYVLPSSDLVTAKTEIFWPERTDPLAALLAASDHRLVWADIEISVPEPSHSSLAWWGVILAVASMRRVGWAMTPVNCHS